MALPPRIGFHASHEQFPPSELLALVRAAEQAGFDCAMSSDHFRPWGAAQGHSGYAWSWLGAAMAGTRLPFGVISAPGTATTPPSSPRARRRWPRCSPAASGWPSAAASG
jgi:alkanesulfonate monooxygenase SsuD/methylene tetrahydromethanopterin reductase-like flavin-dependent oxidoreductase (luciferase family)